MSQFNPAVKDKRSCRAGVDSGQLKITHVRPLLGQGGYFFPPAYPGYSLTVRNSVRRNMTNLLDKAINCDDGDRAAKIIRDALGIETDDVANYYFPQSDYWPTDREGRARIIGNCIKAEAQYLA